MDPLLKTYLGDIQRSLEALHKKVDSLADTKVDKAWCAGCQLRWVSRQYVIGASAALAVVSGVLAFVGAWVGLAIRLH